EGVAGRQLRARHVVAELHGPLGAEAAGRPVRLVVELLDGPKDPGPGVLGVAAAVVEHVGHGLARDAGQPGDVVDVAAGLPRRSLPAGRRSLLLASVPGQADLRPSGACGQTSGAAKRVRGPAEGGHTGLLTRSSSYGGTTLRLLERSSSP